MKNKELFQRIITGFILSLIITVLLVFSYNNYILSGWTALLCSLAVYELYKAAGFNKSFGYLLPTLLIGILISFLGIPHYLILCMIICLVTIVFFLLLMIKKEDFCHFSVRRSLFIPSLIIIFQFQSIREIRLLEYGLYYLGFAILVCTFTDIFAFIFGKLFGKHKLAPKISPKKTWEGSIGGVLSSILFLVLITFVMNRIKGLNFNYLIMIIYILILSITAQFGDFSMSIIKRITGIKDFGKILPGHGGILDRFDSWLITLPLVYILCSFYGFIGN